ncbi:hypothetical protein SCLCIDRAFT_1217849 [Scleroderma citrinum Foug A]|uniref:Uncharacterized protein n=1 Tax=Scleroderma citrinum Foug A TaxID=1036808 RepID=A0A0C3DF00_9AGAM|nr:hypothetical protein SCLCIDRAFT_1217849 [Scleroderma citrinum Foug A]
MADFAHYQCQRRRLAEHDFNLITSKRLDVKEGRTACHLIIAHKRAECIVILV